MSYASSSSSVYLITIKRPYLLSIVEVKAMRYWESQEEEERKAIEACVNCGEKGHDKKSCPHELVSKACRFFICGGKEWKC